MTSALRSSYGVVQTTFMLSLEVMGPGDSLSMLLMRCHNSGMPVGECPGGWQRQRKQPVRRDNGSACLSAVGVVSSSDGLADVDFIWRQILNYVIFSYSTIFGYFILINLILIFLSTIFKLCVIFLLKVLSLFHITVP
jgi:hypothetical protein